MTKKKRRRKKKKRRLHLNLMTRIQSILFNLKKKRKQLLKKQLKKRKKTVGSKPPKRSIMIKSGKRDKRNWQVKLLNRKLIRLV
jgi:hypothetical protein